MATARTCPEPKSFWEKLVKVIALKRARTRKRKRARHAPIHVRDLPEHMKKDIGWTNT